MKIKGNKGITIISLVVTVAILLILSTVMIVEMNTGDKFRDYQYMKADIEVIKNSVLVHYNKYGTIPTLGSILPGINLNGQANANDNTNYYEIDLSKLDNITLNYGKKSDGTDMYIINEKSYEVYYLKGIEDEKGVLKHQ